MRKPGKKIRDKFFKYSIEYFKEFRLFLVFVCVCARVRVCLAGYMMYGVGGLGKISDGIFTFQKDSWLQYREWHGEG